MKHYNEKRQAAAQRLHLTPEAMDSLINNVVRVGHLIRCFSRVHRGVPLDRNGTPESDTDHTVLLSLLSCCVAAKYAPELDIGKVAQYALVHDLIEAHCGDVNTIEYATVDRKEKKKKEAEALEKIKQEHSDFPWLTETLERYENLTPDDPEACFVKALDKAMPAVIHNLNDGLIMEEGQPQFEFPSQLRKEVRGRDADLRDNEWAQGQELALTIRELLMERVLDRHDDKFGWKYG